MSILFLASCSVLDTATLDTAMPIGPKKFHGSIYGSTGLELESLVDNEPEHPSDHTVDPAVFPMTGLHI
ncbi:MAG: hypothetical protein ACP5F3_07285, partial [Candidatus Syntrophosphaera sp.]